MRQPRPISFIFIASGAAIAATLCVTPCFAGDLTAELGGPKGPVRVAGSVDAAPGTEVAVVLALEEGGGSIETRVKIGSGGRVEATLGPFRRRLVTGTYIASVNPPGEAELGRARVVVGDADQAAAVRAAAARGLARMLEWERRAFTALQQRARFVRAVAAIDGVDPGTVVPPALEELAALRAGLGKSLLLEARRGLRDIRTSAPIRPHAAAEAAVARIPEAIEDSASAERVFLEALASGKTPEPRAADSARENVLALVRDARTGLGLSGDAPEGALADARGVDLDAWSSLDLARVERGSTDGARFRGETTGFSLEAPDGWRFGASQSRHDVRVLLTPTDAAAAGCWAYVEVREVTLPPKATGKALLDALARAAEVTAWERWTSYRRRSGRALTVPDDAMPDGNRAAYDLAFTAEVPRGEEGRVTYGGRARLLLSRDRRRALAVVVLGPQDRVAAIEEDAEAIVRSFRLHD